MSVHTTADKAIDKAKSLLLEASQQLLAALDEKTWGSSEFGDDYINTMHEVALELLKLKRKL
jgi:hypothetical protein